MTSTGNIFDNGASTLYGGNPSHPEAQIMDTLTVNEWRLIKDALTELEVHARENERYNQKVVTEGCRSTSTPPEGYCSLCKGAEHEATQAALRALAIKQLAAKIKV